MFRTGHYLFDVLFDFGAGQHNLSPAAGASNAKIHADTQNSKGVCAAGMRLFGLDHIAYMNIHARHFLSLVVAVLRTHRVRQQVILLYALHVEKANIPMGYCIEIKYTAAKMREIKGEEDHL